MKIIRRECQFNGKKNQKFYHERFDNYKEFYDVIMSRQNNAHKTIQYIMDSHDTSWMGVSSVDQARDMLLNGWEQNVEKMKVEFKKQLNEVEYNRKPKMFNNVAGFMPVVPNALRGLPNSMIDTRMEPKKSKILNFMVAIDRACSNSVDTIIKKMSKIFAYVAMLERSGQYRCRIEVFFTAFSEHNTEKPKTSVSVLVKNENQLFDIKRLCFPVIHPAMLRLFGFAWAESLPVRYSEIAYESSYGTAFEHFSDRNKEDFMNAVTEGSEKVICLDLHSDIEEIVGREVK